jgi:hypothetical protein
MSRPAKHAKAAPEVQQLGQEAQGVIEQAQGWANTQGGLGLESYWAHVDGFVAGYYAALNRKESQ